jgi:hypothetical protein
MTSVTPLPGIFTTVEAERVVLIGAGDLADEVEAGLDALGAEVHRLHEPDEAEVESALADGRADAWRSSRATTPSCCGWRCSCAPRRPTSGCS